MSMIITCMDRLVICRLVIDTNQTGSGLGFWIITQFPMVAWGKRNSHSTVASTNIQGVVEDLGLGPQRKRL